MKEYDEKVQQEIKQQVEVQRQPINYAQLPLLCMRNYSYIDDRVWSDAINLLVEHGTWKQDMTIEERLNRADELLRELLMSGYITVKPYEDRIVASDNLKMMWQHR